MNQYRTSNFACLVACLAGEQTTYTEEFFNGQQPASGVAFPFASESLFSLAVTEALLPTLYPRLRDLRRLHQLPPKIASFLQTVTQLNAERNQFVLDELQAFATILNRHDIQPLVLKGAAYLLTGVYANDDLGSRYLYDVDLAIPESQMAVADTALHQAGYRPSTTDEMARFRHHHVPLRKPGGISFELHHCLSLGNASRRLLTISEMLDKSTVLEWQGGVQLRIPSPEHLITHLILHSQIQHAYQERIWPPLRAMYDLLLLTSRFADFLNWPDIEYRFRSAGQHTTFKLHLLQVEKTLGLACPLPITLTPLEKLRWFRRNLLNRWPALRFLDPAYLLLASLSRRVRLLQSVLSTPGGWKQASRMFLNPGFYRRIIGEITLTRDPNS
jgi:hypothetical protein